MNCCWRHQRKRQHTPLKMATILGAILLQAVLLPALAATPQGGPAPSAALAAKLDDYLTRCAAFGFSGSVLVEKDGATLLSKGYGLADRRTGKANAPDTIHDIGSLTKQFTAVAILRLEQDGKLSVKDPISKFFRDVPADKRRIQLHHLLSHTSGLPRSDEKIGSALQDREELVRLVLGLPLASDPGARHLYSNIGYDLLGVVVEQVSGQPFETYLAERLFRPAGFESTGFRGQSGLDAGRVARGAEEPPEADLAGSSIQGEQEDEWDPTLASKGWYSWGLRGAGGVLTTTLDLQRWRRALHSDAVLAAEQRAKLFKPVAGDYGYGWYVTRTSRGTKWIEHGGTTNNGFDCKMTMFPDEGVMMVVLGNVGSLIVPYVNLNLGKLVFGEKVEWPPEVGPVDASRLLALAGDYEATGEARFALEAGNGALVLAAEEPEAFALLAPPLSSRNKDVLERSRKIAAELAKDRFDALHAAERKEHPLFFFDNWWKRLRDQHGPLRSVTLLGGSESPPSGPMALLDVRFEKGREILRLLWSGDNTLTGTMIGPPYPSRLRLAACSAERFVCFDLKASRVVAELKAAGKDAASGLVLDVAGTSVPLRRAKR